MGTIWRATDELLTRPVAVKLLRPELAADPQFLARFRAEARHAAAVRHPGVATVHDYGEHDNGKGSEHDGPAGGRADAAHPSTRPPLGTDPDDTVVDLRAPAPALDADRPPATAWLVMDLVEGEPLSAVLAREGRVGWERTLQLLAEVADALAAAHAVGVVHRDVKPGNLLLAADAGATHPPQRPGGRQRVVVTDFGIARATGAASITRTGMLVGTAAYLSPVLAAGRPASAASDLYALGVVAYECLAGRKPFVGDTDLAVALAHGRDPVPPLPDDVPAAVRALVLRLLAKDPQQRPAGAAAVAARARLVAADPPSGLTREADPPAPTAVLPVPPVPDGSAHGTEVAEVAEVAGAAAPMTAPGTGADPADPAHRARRPLLLGVVAGGVLLLGGLVAGALLGAANRPAASTPSPQRPSATATPSSTVRLDPADYVGQPADRVQAELTRLGLGVRLVGTVGGGPVGTVAALEPSGVVARGTTVTLRLVDRMPQEAPQTGPTTKHGPQGEHGKKSGTKPGKGDRKGEG
ncbi:MAG: serine/threonine-protein kinase [Motilibacteraceae bacterium]